MVTGMVMEVISVPFVPVKMFSSGNLGCATCVNVLKLSFYFPGINS